MPEWLKGADCKSVGDAYDGSNPSLPTNFFMEHFYKCFFLFVRKLKAHALHELVLVFFIHIYVTHSVQIVDNEFLGVSVVTCEGIRTVGTVCGLFVYSH